MESKYKYGVLGAGAVRTSLIGRLPGRARHIGPVCASSYRLASRIANAIKAGFSVRSADELNSASTVLVYAPPEHLDEVVGMLERSAISWKGKSLIFCDCTVHEERRRAFEAKGASAAVVREFAARLIVDGEDGGVLRVVQDMARGLGLKVVRISKGAADAFGAAVMLSTAAITPLIDRAAELLREAGIRDAEAARMAAWLFENTARDYAHSGQQSWAWYVRAPDADQAAGQARREEILRELVLYGLERFGKHEGVKAKLKALAAPAGGE